MTKSATDVMQEIVFSAVIDSIVALKAASKGLPNTLLRDLNAIHSNTTLADLPKELQDSIAATVRAAFTRLLKEGYSVSPGQPAQSRPAAPRRDAAGQGPRPGRSGPRRDGPPGSRRDGPPGARRDGAPGARPGGGDPSKRPPRGGRPGGGKPRGPRT